MDDFHGHWPPFEVVRARIPHLKLRRTEAPREMWNNLESPRSRDLHSNLPHPSSSVLALDFPVGGTVWPDSEIKNWRGKTRHGSLQLGQPEL